VRGTWVFVVLALAVGLAAGVGSYTFVYARGASYLTNDPAACANCHAMREQHDAWLKSSHRSVAVCNDCHTPQDVLGKYKTKGLNGFWHSFYFTRGDFPEPIRITPRNEAVTEAACRRCHADTVDQMIDNHGRNALACLRCHRSVGHLH
jgi:cytochrome c nitrite reductase small subunit